MGEERAGPRKEMVYWVNRKALELIPECIGKVRLGLKPVRDFTIKLPSFREGEGEGESSNTASGSNVATRSICSNKFLISLRMKKYSRFYSLRIRSFHFIFPLSSTYVRHLKMGFTLFSEQRGYYCHLLEGPD